MKSRVKIFMKKKLLIVCAVLICATWMAACGKDASEDARSGSGKENTEQERDEREDSTPETATESTVTENSTQDSAPVSNVISDVDISDYVYYSTAGDEFVAPKENAIEGIPYELTDEEKKILIPDSDVYVITADEVKDYEYIIEGEKITYFAAASCSFTDEGKYDKDCTIFFFEDDIIAAKSYDVLSASASDSVKYELDGRKVIQSRSISGCEWIDEYVSLCIDGGYSYIVACDSGRLTGDVRARAVALFDREDTVSVADSNDKPDDQIVVADTNDNSDPSLNGTQNGNGGDGTNATSQINSILSQAAGDYGSFKLVDYGNGTYALVDINYTYQQRVGESPNYTWVENGFQGQSSLFGDGLGAEDMGDGVFVEVNLTLEREYRVVINKGGAIAFYGVDGGGMDFPRIDY